jgi:sugar lactone lactonase YvrE
VKWEAELVVDAKSVLGEGPHWDADSQSLLWVDIFGNKLHRFHPGEGKLEAFDFDEYVTAAVPAKNGDILLTFPHSIGAFNTKSGELRVLQEGIEADKPNNRFNDGKCDVTGRFWGGTMSMNGERQQGSVYSLDADLTLRVRDEFGSVTCSNGIGWSPDGRTMYYIDTPTYAVIAFDCDAASGSLTNRRTAIPVPNEFSSPDGMTVDAEGMLWVAHWGGYRVTRWNPATAELIGTVDVPAPQVTSCTFGGANLDELYITSARTGLADEVLARYPMTGGVFRVKPGVKGLPNNTFG